MIPNNYLEKVYAGFIGMNAGIRLGAPVEPTIWTYERIREVYGDITDYVKDFKNFAADDDANGPVFFLRALYDDAKDRELKPQDVARAWLNYTREGVGMFWWGGYGISTEHTAFLNLKNGVEAPYSGSIELNGATIAEQIGGQIFIDTWGLIWPNNPEKAAEYGAYAASVSHDGEGIYGAKFFCAAIALAFSCNDIEEIICKSLEFLPHDSKYVAVANAVLDFYKKHPDDFRLCRDMLEAEWGYDRYPGACHMIPNAGVCILSMIYGQGDFNKTIEIATMCGWDTDCNAGNVGTVLGVMVGLDGIAPKYREPINDSIVLSSISGYLNILDIPTYAKELALLGYRMSGETPPKDLSCHEGEIYFDFELPGSTHNFRVSDRFLCHLSHSDKITYGSSKGALRVTFDRMVRGQDFKIYYKPYYLRSDFDDERYMPVFTPKAYSGQTVSMKVYLEQWNGLVPVSFALYVHVVNEKSDRIIQHIKGTQGKWIDVEFQIPDTDGGLIDEIGIILESNDISKYKSLGNVYIDNFSITGKAEYAISTDKQNVNFGCISPFSHNHGAWKLELGGIHALSCGFAASYAGNYFSKNYSVETTVTPLVGNGHMVAIRAQGAERGYHFGFDAKGTVACFKNDFGLIKIAEAAFDWQLQQKYCVKLVADGKVIDFYVNGEKLLSIEDTSYGYGMFGMSRLYMGRCVYGDFKIKEL